jgi:hypothetical protein
VVIGAGLGREAEDHISILRNWDQKRAETTRCHGLDTGGEKKKTRESNFISHKGVVSDHHP